VPCNRHLQPIISIVGGTWREPSRRGARPQKIRARSCLPNRSPQEERASSAGGRSHADLLCHWESREAHRISQHQL